MAPRAERHAPQPESRPRESCALVGSRFPETPAGRGLSPPVLRTLRSGFGSRLGR